jgi:hypothetical protein
MEMEEHVPLLSGGDFSLFPVLPNCSMRTDGQTEVVKFNSRFSQFCECAQNAVFAFLQRGLSDMWGPFLVVPLFVRFEVLLAVTMKAAVVCM